MFKRTGALAITLAIYGLSQMPAFAHADLENSNPAPGSSATDIKEIKLAFSEGVNPKFSGLDLKDGAGNAMQIGSATINSANKKELIVPVSVNLSPGTYTVEWHAVSDDMHRIKGKFTFKVGQ